MILLHSRWNKLQSLMHNAERTVEDDFNTYWCETYSLTFLILFDHYEVY